MDMFVLEIIHAAGGFARKNQPAGFFRRKPEFIHGFLLFVGQHPGVQRFCEIFYLQEFPVDDAAAQVR